jgi:type I restriction enzyme S subunit
MGRYQAYPEYKDSGVEWLGQVPLHWDIKRVGSLFEERREKVNDVDFPPLSVTMQGIVPQLDNAAKSDAGDNRKLVKAGDFVINSRSDRKGASGISYLTGSVSLISIVMSPRKYQSQYFHHLFRCQAFQEEFYRYGKGIVADLWSTNSSELKNILVPDLPQEEADLIASFLDQETAKIDTLIEQQQQLIQLLKEKRQAVISHAVTKGLNLDAPMKDSGVEWLGEVPEHWVISTVKNFCFINDGNHGEEYPTDSDFVAAEEGVPFIRASDFDEWQIVETDLKYISKEKNSSMRKGRLQDGDILFVNRGSTIGKLCLIDSAYAGSNLNSQIAYLRTNKDQMHYGYLAFFLSSSYIQTRIFSEIQGGALPQYPLKHIARLIVCQPPLAEQIDIFKTLSKQIKIFRESIQNAEAANTLLQERRTALISAAVTGKIDVRNWQAPTN